MDSKQLSLVAQYDDLMRYCEQLIGGDLIESKVRILLNNCEKQRRLWVKERNDLIELKKDYNKSSSKIRTLETTLRNVREAFSQEVSLREKVQRERDALRKKLNQVKEYLIEDSQTKDITKESRTGLKEILSEIDQHKLTTVVEEESSDKSLSDIDFSKTEDNIVFDNRNSSGFSIGHDINIKYAEKMDTAPVFENEDDFEMLDEANIRTPVKRTPSVQSKMSTLSQTLIKQRQMNQPNQLLVDNRKHQYVDKKMFRGEKCCVCRKTFKFCSTASRCRDCLATSCKAPECKDKVPVPCIPYVSRTNIGKQGRLILISDFVQSNCKPCVPALIVHCVKEIERRGLEEIGIYRLAASEKEVRELKERILNSKQGIPQLSDKDVHVLCSVVKKFLNELDEALVSRIAWRDFVEAVNIVDSDERKSRIKEAVLNLPNANRDTLAFLMLHLHRVIAEEKENKMGIMAVSRIFGPTVLGYSMKDPPQMQMHEEVKKQHQVVEYLLSLDDEFWRSILDLDVNNHLSIPSISSPGNSSIYHSLEQQLKSHPSIGNRLCGGRITSGTITPLKNSKSNKNFNFKPLF